MCRIKRYISLVIMCIVLLTGLCACGDREIVLTTAFESKELMRINNKSCYLPEMMLYLTTVQNKYEEVYGDKLWQQSEDGVSLEKRVKDMVLAKVAQVKVLVLLAESYEIELSEEELLEVSIQAKEFYESLTETEKKLIDVTEEDIYDIYREYALSNKVYDYVIRDVNPEISDDEARTVTVLQIFIKTYALDQNGKAVEYTNRAKEEARKKAETAREAILSEESSFESVAAKYNEADAETVSFGREEMPKEVEDVAFDLEKNEVSEIVETSTGYYIFKCINDFDLEETQTNKIHILEKRKQEVFDETYDEFLTTLTKTLNEKLYDSIIMIHSPEVTTTSFFDVDF